MPPTDAAALRLGRNVAAAIFWRKARAGWRVKHERRVGPTDGVSQLSDQQLQAELRRLSQSESDPE